MRIQLKIIGQLCKQDSNIYKKMKEPRRQRRKQGQPQISTNYASKGRFTHQTHESYERSTDFGF